MDLADDGKRRYRVSQHWQKPVVPGRPVLGLRRGRTRTERGSVEHSGARRGNKDVAVGATSPLNERRRRLETYFRAPIHRIAGRTPVSAGSCRHRGTIGTAAGGCTPAAILVSRRTRKYLTLEDIFRALYLRGTLL